MLPGDTRALPAVGDSFRGEFYYRHCLATLNLRSEHPPVSLDRIAERLVPACRQGGSCESDGLASKRAGAGDACRLIRSDVN